MTDVYVVTYQESNEGGSVVGVTATLDGAKALADADARGAGMFKDGTEWERFAVMGVDTWTRWRNTAHMFDQIERWPVQS